MFGKTANTRLLNVLCDMNANDKIIKDDERIFMAEQIAKNRKTTHNI